jgi:hypothetical protein
MPRTTHFKNYLPQLSQHLLQKIVQVKPVGNLVQEKHYACESFSFRVSKTLQTVEVTSPHTTIFTMLQLVISLNIFPVPRTLSCLNSFRNSFFQLRKSRNCCWPVESKVVVGVVGIETLVVVELLHASPPPRPESPKGTTSIDA